MRHRRIRTKRTASIRKYLWTAVLFCMGLPVLGGFYGKQETAGETDDRERYVIVRESMAGREEVPLEEYLVGALAGSIPEDFEAEACRAQAVILRTNAVCIAEREGVEAIPYEVLGQKSLTVGELQEKWGEDYGARYARLKEAVRDTKGQVLQYKGICVELPFFPLSAGKTRTAAEVWPDDPNIYPYLESVSCGEDIFSDQYEKEIQMREQDLEEMLGELFGTEEDVAPEEIEYTYDSAGYVSEVIWEGESVSGEAFREKAGLSSACFSIENEENNVRIITKGSGHGLGMSQYTADVLADEGKGYREILNYFFPACEIVKN